MFKALLIILLIFLPQYPCFTTCPACVCSCKANCDATTKASTTPCLICDLIKNNPHKFYLPPDDQEDINPTILTILIRYKWEKVESFDEASLCWLWGNNDVAMRDFAKNSLGNNSMGEPLWRKRLINQIVNEEAMINKIDFALNLRNHANNTPAPLILSNFYPETYVMSNDIDCVNFFKKAKEDEDNNRPSVWVKKLGNTANGNDIEIITDIQKIKQKLTVDNALCNDKALSDYSNHVLLQRYLPSPLLLLDRKSEIRVYWLLACLDPLLVFLYPYGSVRLNSVPFENSDYSNALKHITNIEQQKRFIKSDQSGQALPLDELKWDFDRLEKDLLERGLATPGYIQKKLLKQIATILAYSINATKESLHTDRAYFGLYGADFIIQQDPQTDYLRPYLTELQFAPSLILDSSVKAKVIPPMVSEAINLVLESRYKLQMIEDLKITDPDELESAKETSDMIMEKWWSKRKFIRVIDEFPGTGTFYHPVHP